jgi:Neurotransmitter-gated ion-channel ligand binding domain
MLQECRLKFGSWTYDGFKLDISFYGNSDMVDVSDYVKSNEWELIEHPGRRNIRYYPCCSDKPFPDLTFTVRLRRMSVFYNYILIFPCALLSVLTLVIFWLPPESPAKILLGWLTVLYIGLVHVSYLQFELSTFQFCRQSDS